MNKESFFNLLASKLSNYNQIEVDKAISYYNEIIDDRIEDGMSESEAIVALGDIENIISNIISDISITSIVKSKFNDSKKKSSNKALWTTLIIIGSPIWFSLGIAFVAVIFAFYVVIWSFIFTLCAMLFAFALTTLAGLVCGTLYIFTQPIHMTLLLFGVSLIFGGLTLILIHPIIISVKSLTSLTKIVIIKIKNLIIKKR